MEDGTVEAQKTKLDIGYDHVLSAYKMMNGSIDQALLEVEKAEAIARGFDNSQDAQKLMAHCCECKATIYGNLGKEKERREMLEKIVEIRSYLEFDDPVVRDSSYVSLTLSLAELRQFEKARKYADMVIESSGSDESVDAGRRLFNAIVAYINEEEIYRVKVKGVLMLAREKFEKHLSAAVFRDLLQIQLELADIVYYYELDAYKAHLEFDQIWKYAESVGIDNCDLGMLLNSTEIATEYSKDHMDLNLLWIRRQMQICAMLIDEGEGDYDKVKSYVKKNISLFLLDLNMDESVTIERALRWVEITKQQTRDERENAQAQWLAGFALVCLGKTLETARKGIRLIRNSIKVLKVTKGNTDKTDFDAVSVGEDCIARYHFKRKEYDLAKDWYQAAIEDLKLSGVQTQNKYRKRFAAGLMECLKYIN
jgi:tetratricopeptide (TPR) repeat protein